MFDFLSKRLHRDELSCIFAIESGEISCALVEYKKGQKPFIHHISSHTIDHHSFDANRLVPLMLSSLHRASEHLLKYAFNKKESKKLNIHNLKNIYVFFGSPWHISEIITTTKESDKPFFINQNLLNSLAKGENKPENPVTVIEEIITSIKSNGYILKSPIHKKVNSLEVSSFVSHVDKTLISDIKNTLDITFPGISTIFHTIGSAIFVSIKHILKKEDLVMIIPEHNMTEITMIRNGKIENNISIPIGKHHTINKIQESSKMNRRLALSMFEMSREDKLETKRQKEMTIIVEEARQEFTKSFSEALSRIFVESAMPNTMIITDNSPESEMMKDWIQNDSEINKMFSVEKPEIYCLKKYEMLNFIDLSKTVTKSLQKDQNVEMLSLALFINLI